MEKYLIDTNIFLEILLAQEKKEACKQYLNNNIGRLYISDFSLHSIGVILFRLGRKSDFNLFVDDILPKVQLLTLPAGSYKTVAETGEKFNLDFDDSYQAAIAKAHKLTISTFDKDFKKIAKEQKVNFL